jgi:hypothetical protein
MREARRNPQLPVVLAAQLHANPLAEARAAAPDVDRHVEHAASRHAHELALRLRRQLVVETAQHAARRARMVVLHELVAGAGELVEQLLVEALHEEAALVAEHARLEHHDVGDGGGHGLHQNNLSLSSCWRYCP